MFQILTMTEAKLSSLTPRSEKHGDDDKPAVSLAIEIEAANTLLDTIDPTLRQALFKAVDDQPVLPGVESSTPVLRSNSIDRVLLPNKHEGWTLAVDDGIDDTDPMSFGSCKVDKFSVEPKQGGSISLRLRVGTSDIDAARMGMLGMHVGQPIWITLTAPVRQPEAIDASSSAKDLPPTAGDLFSAEHGAGEGGGDDDGPGDEPRQTQPGDPDHVNWPFPKSSTGATQEPPQDVVIETSRPGTRTARGRAKTKAALAEGLAAHEASGA
jgi:hypothetical protein